MGSGPQSTSSLVWELLRAITPICLPQGLAVRPQTSFPYTQWSLHPQATISTMTKELRTLQVQFEEAISTHQREAETLREKLREIAAKRSSVRREVRWSLEEREEAAERGGMQEKGEHPRKRQMTAPFGLAARGISQSGKMAPGSWNQLGKAHPGLIEDTISSPKFSLQKNWI